MEVILALVMLVGGLAGGYFIGRKAVKTLAPVKASESSNERTLAYGERFLLCNQWQTILETFQRELPHTTSVAEVVGAFAQAVRRDFTDMQLVFAVGPLKEIVLLHTMASTNQSHVNLSTGSCFVSMPHMDQALLEELTSELYHVLKQQQHASTRWFLLREFQPTLQTRLSERYGLDGQGIIIPLRSGTVLCGVLLLMSPNLAKNADTLSDHGRFAGMGVDVIATWIRCMAPQLLAGTATDPIGDLPIHALASLSILEQSAAMLQENAESQEQVAELASYARAINEQEAEISLLAAQTCQAIRRICQADFTLFLCPASPEPGADFALYAVEAGSWSWSSYQGYAGVETHPQLDEALVKHWPDRFIAQMRTTSEVIHARSRGEALLLAKNVAETLSAESLLIVPAHIRAHCAAIIVAGRKGPGGVADSQVLVSSSVAALASMSIATMRLLQQTQTLQQSATEGWKLATTVIKQAITTLAGIVQKQGILTATNPQKVAEVAEAIALRLRLTPADVRQISIAATLCDLGMLIIPLSILRKAGGLSEDEVRLVQSHPGMSVAMLEPFDMLKGALPLILHHHERYDGTGYPKQLGGVNIPRGASIIAVADAFVHMQMERPYRPAMTQQSVLAYLKQESGKQFDPTAVQALMKSLLQEVTGPEAA
jgi:HD-GYP domain-containing protein (c-di-GMP phosphodiesterase class II)